MSKCVIYKYLMIKKIYIYIYISNKTCNGEFDRYTLFYYMVYRKLKSSSN